MPAPEPLIRLRERLLVLAGKLAWLGPLLARVTVGVVFLQTGWGKLHDLDKVTSFFTELNIPVPAFQARLVAGTELIGGALLLVGLLSRLAALPLAFSMAIAIVTARHGDITGLAALLGLEEWTYVVLFVWITLAGPGPVSLDRAFAPFWTRRASQPPRARDTMRAP